MVRGAGDGAELLRQRVSEIDEVEPLALDGQTAGIETGEVEQLRGELGQAVDLLAHGGHELGLGLWIQLLVGHQLEEAAEGEKRCAQLVRRVGDELPPRVLELGQALPHPLEGGGQLGKLVPPGIDHGLAEVTARDPIGCALEPPDPAGEERSQRDSRRAARPRGR